MLTNAIILNPLTIRSYSTAALTFPQVEASEGVLGVPVDPRLNVQKVLVNSRAE